MWTVFILATKCHSKWKKGLFFFFYMDATSAMFDSQFDWMRIKLKKKKLQIKRKVFMSMSTCWGVCGLCLNKHWNFPAFLFLLIYFLSVLFSQYCNASLDITQASLSFGASAESNLVRSAAARRIRLSFFRLLWNVPFFFNIQNTQGSQIADMCERGSETPAFFHAPLCKTPHCLFKEHWTL